MFLIERLKDERSATRAIVALVLGLALIQAVLQLFFFTDIGPDDEQLIEWAATLRLGALDQPTLLSNVAWALDRLGVAPRDFIIVARQFFVAGAIIFLGLGLLRLTDDHLAAWSGAFFLTLLYSVKGKIIVVYTHSSILLLSIALLFYLATRLLEHRSLARYLGVGLAAAFVFHSKYNGVLFVVCVAIAAFYNRTARRIVWDKRSLASLAILVAMAAPALVWGYLNQEAVESTFDKYQFDRTDAWPTWEVFEAYLHEMQAALLLFAPALLVAVVRKDVEATAAFRTERFRFLAAYCLTFLALAIVMAEIAQVGDVNMRWILPGTIFSAALLGWMTSSLLTPPWRSLLLAGLSLHWVFAHVWVFVRYL